MHDERTPRPLTRRDCLTLAGATAALAACPPLAEAAHRNTRAPLIDILGGLGDPNRTAPEGTESPDIWSIDERAINDGHRAGLSAFHQTVGYVAGPGDPWALTLADIRRWRAFIDRHDVDLALVRSAADVDHARRAGRIGVILGFQNTAMLGDDPGRVATCAAEGVRVIQLTYNVANAVGDGSMVAENRGLTEFGRRIVHELNRHRVIVDLSHSGERTCLDAIDASKAPIAITHTGCRAIADLPRNKTDAELRLVASRGGVVGIYLMPFLAIGRQPTADDLVMHLEHALTVCGEDHVAIGTDGVLSAVEDLGAYRRQLATEVAARRAAGIAATGEREDIVPFLPDLDGWDKFARLREKLAARGHRASRIDKIMGGNFLAYARRIWGA